MKYSCLIFLLAFIFNASFATVRGDIKKGNINYKKGIYQEAEKYYSEAADKSNNAIIANNKGLAFYKLGEIEKSKKEFIKALKMEGNNKVKSDINYNLANIYKSQEDIENAINYYKKSLVLNRNNHEAKNNLLAAIKQQQKQKKKQSKDTKDNKKNGDKQKQEQQQQKGNNENDQQSKKSINKDKISKEDAERILKMLEQKKEAEKGDEKTNIGVIKVDKNW